ncbi:MAG: Uma2 family endonuclease [Oscillatoriales cyanobacterium C42_A2020_001]|nr:Uma2 family endonuclease [Leptolyngbyaceae cyanobacterium C42_A2020_001]
MVATPHPDHMTIAEYLDWEPLQELRYEYVHGIVIAMTGGTIPHNDIALNLYRTLYPHVQSNGCRINVADVKLEISSDSPYYYPDVIVTCDPRDLNARRLLRYPKLIIEVLSPGTEAKDRGEKFAYYRSSSTLQEYILVESEKIGVECYRRGEGRLWLYYPYTSGDIITLESIGCRVPIDLLYENVSFEESLLP